MRFVIFVMGILLLGLSACSSDTSSIVTIRSNVGVDNLTPGMVVGQDFKIADDYFSTSVKMIPLSEPDIYAIDLENIESPYFMWVCYPQITRGSPTRLILLEDNKSGIANSEFTVLEVTTIDTAKALDIYGGTRGTRANGW